VAELLRVEDLSVHYHTEQGVVRVLDGVDLAIARGEVVGLVGESGCGKSTLGRAILGILPRQSAEVLSGRILFQGDDLLRLPHAEVARGIRGRRITFIPQDPFGSFNPLFTIGQQMLELMKWKSPALSPDAATAGGLFRPYGRARRRRDRDAVLGLLRDVQIPNPEQALTKLPNELSGGQRQRIMIAMALLPEPELIIADEPTTALDVTIQAQILRLLFHLVKDRGVSVLFTTHDLGTAYEICDRVTVMYAGQEAEAAPTESFFRAPRHPYTGKLLESLPRPDGAIADIPGEIPGLIDPPPGCRFHTRCPRASGRCREERPPVHLAAPDHRVRCFHPLEVPG
jgi:peptide/nickel transport system ATP-binding protein